MSMFYNSSHQPAKSIKEAKCQNKYSSKAYFKSFQVKFQRREAYAQELPHYGLKKRTAGEIDGVTSNGTHSNILKTPKVLKQNQMENRHPESHGHSSDDVVALAASNPITANASVNHKKLLL
ncbi:hypothetical protein KIW84_013781 [Lathyrus oleraceus]|uniref:Uncharacterized protein n=1 Tax=Pisum sativum TaxID=3888 RepID=A0A9D5BLD2_PEA|nr:hypothetical protein KIW84_013781 [Pisum sativum]